MKVVARYSLIDPKGKIHLIEDTTQDFHTKYGFISHTYFDDSFIGKKIKTNKGETFYLVKSTSYDIFSRLKRKPQIILKKDLGFIVANSLIDNNSVCLDSGTGSGFCSIFLAMHSKKVYSIDINDENLKIAKENALKMGLKNINFINSDFTKTLNLKIKNKIKDNSIDLIVLDLPEPWQAIDNILSYLKIGGFLISYSPSVTQVLKMNNFLSDSKKFLILKNSQLVEFPWKISGRVARPESMMLLHTGFLTLCRRILK